MQYSRQNRLLKSAEFQAVFRQHTRSEDQYLKVLARKNTSTKHRLGLAVAKKNCRRAVDRNRIKRIVRESFRHHLAGRASGIPMDFVVMSKPESTAVSNAVLQRSLQRHWHELLTRAGQEHTRTQT
ncbi:MAG: ribonuclease P protein component [Thiohalobacterales bacterium]|nr:ribonuclease P protein component [Thiohalobacterales bacterium]